MTDASCRCGQPKGRWFTAYGYLHESLIRCQGCEERLDAACREFDAVLFGSIRRGPVVVSLADEDGHVIDDRPCDLHFDTSPLVHYTEDDPS